MCDAAGGGSRATPHAPRRARRRARALRPARPHARQQPLRRGQRPLRDRRRATQITPPFRFEHWEQLDRIDTAPLRAHLAQPRLVGLLVVRLGGYGAGVYSDERLVSGKHGVRFVKNRNKKGGSSSNRFRRRRVEQARDAYDRACALAEEILGAAGRARRVRRGRRSRGDRAGDGALAAPDGPERARAHAARARARGAPRAARATRPRAVVVDASS